MLIVAHERKRRRTVCASVNRQHKLSLRLLDGEKGVSLYIRITIRVYSASRTLPQVL